MKFHIWALLPVSTMLLASPSPAMQRTNEIRQAQTSEAAPRGGADMCEARGNRSRGGIGRALRSARNSGLIGTVAGRTGGGYLAGSVAETAIDIGTAEAERRAADASRNADGQSRKC